MPHCVLQVSQGRQKGITLTNRLGTIGRGDHNLTPPSRMTLAFCQGKLPAYLDCQLNMIDARDIASGLRAAMKVGRPPDSLPARRSKPAADRMADDRRSSGRKRSTSLAGFLPVGAYRGVCQRMGRRSPNRPDADGNYHRSKVDAAQYVF